MIYRQPQSGPLSDLIQANRTIHRHLEQLYLDLLEALTDCDFTAALVRWRSLEGRLLRHAGFEEQRLLPLLADGDRTARLVEGDHKIILRLLEGLSVQLDGFATEPPDRRGMLQALPPLVRLGGILEHHTERENQLLYPELAAQLAVGQADALARQLLALDRD